MHALISGIGADELDATDAAERPREPLRTGAMAGVYDQSRSDLDYLGWPRAAECFASHADAAKAEDWSPSSTWEMSWQSKHQPR